MKKYLVINIEDGNDFYLIDDLDGLLREMYSQELSIYEFQVVKSIFFENYKVFTSKSNITELSFKWIIKE
jgi:hypothetical protein